SHDDSGIHSRDAPSLVCRRSLVGRDLGRLQAPAPQGREGCDIERLSDPFPLKIPGAAPTIQGMNQQFPRTLGELKLSSYHERHAGGRTVKDEMRGNLQKMLCRREPLSPGIVGYDEPVVPQLVNAILSRHNMILLGLRGQAKSRILRDL